MDFFIGILVGVVIAGLVCAAIIFAVANAVDEDIAAALNKEEDEDGELLLVPGLEVRVTDATTGEVFFGAVYKEAA